MKSTSVYLLTASGLLFISVALYIVFGIPTTKKEGFATYRSSPPPSAQASTAAIVKALATTKAVAQTQPAAKTAEKAKVAAAVLEQTKIDTLAYGLHEKDVDIARIRKSKAESDEEITQKLGTIRDLSERLEASEDVKNMALNEVNGLQTNLDKAVQERETSEINFRETKLNLDDQVRRNTELNKVLAQTQKEMAAHTDRCMTTDNELKAAKIGVERYNVEKKVSDNIIVQLKAQLGKVTKSDPVSQKIQVELDRANLQSKAIQTQLSDAKTKLATLEKESKEQKAQLATLQADVKKLQSTKDLAEREMLLAQGRFETERIANTTAQGTITALREKLVARDKITDGITTQYKTIKKQYDVLDKAHKVDKEENKALQAMLKKQSEEIALLKSIPKVQATPTGTGQLPLRK
jgi:chromosome segregation ATPase